MTVCEIKKARKEGNKKENLKLERKKEKNKFLTYLGLWDVFTNQAAVDFVHLKLKQFPDQHLKVTTLLAEEAIKLGLILFFRPFP